MESKDILKVNPIQTYGSPVYIVNQIFKGKENFEQALRELAHELYVA
jgi:type I restriction enzyme R subunit